MQAMKAVHLTALILVIVGALNWGLIGLFQFDLVAALFGGPTAVLSRVAYTLVGVAGLIAAATGAAIFNGARLTDLPGPRTKMHA